MCDPAGIAMQLVGTLASSVFSGMTSSNNSDNTAQIMAAENERQRQLQAEANKHVMDSLNQFTPDQRQQYETQIAGQQKQVYNNALADAAQRVTLNSGVAGNVSSDYTGAQSRANNNEIARMASLVGNQSALDAAGRLRQQDALAIGDLALQNGMLGNFSANSQALAGQAANAAANQPPGVGQSLIGGALQGIAGGALNGIKSRPAPWTGHPAVTNRQLDAWKPTRSPAFH